MANSNLRTAQKAKNDEFYTQREDIETELSHYAEHFRGKVVYCNCDDPVDSEFWKFFVRNFKPWGLKKLMATHYEPDEKNYSYSLELTEDTNGDGRVDINDEPTVTRLPCNGDFRSAACIELLKRADIVVTNPPFSLFREYVAQLMEYGKKFLIIGNMNAVTYKEIFPLIQGNQMWVGVNAKGGSRKGNSMSFIVPDDYDGRVVIEKNNRVAQISAWWFTNLDHRNSHEKIDLRGNHYDEALYPFYDNLDAIEVSKTENIPSDFDGLMGVPISFLAKYSPEQFDIVGFWNAGVSGDEIGAAYCDAVSAGKKIKWNGPTVNGQTKYFRILIRRK